MQDGYLDYCTEKRVKILSSPPGCSEVMEAVRSLCTLWDYVAHGAGKAPHPTRQTARGHFPHKGTEQPQLQRHPTRQQLHHPGKEKHDYM